MAEPHDTPAPTDPAHTDRDSDSVETVTDPGNASAPTSGTDSGTDSGTGLRVDPVGLLAGVTAIVVAVLAMTDVLGRIDAGVAVAATTVVVGALLLVGIIAGRRDGR